MSLLWLDLEHAFQMMRKAPGVTLAAILSLALGVGVNMGVFGWANALILRPLSGVADQDTLVMVDQVAPSGTDRRLSYPDFCDVRRQTTAFSTLTASTGQPVSFAIDGNADRLWGQLVSGSFFTTLGVKATLGRTFGAEEDDLATPSVVVISHRLWQRRFGGDRGVLGRPVQIGGSPFTIVGVAPPEFFGNIAGLSFDLWLPITADARIQAAGGRLEARDAHWVSAMGRLRAGASLEQARAELAALARGLAEQYPETNRGSRFVVEPLWNAPFGAQNVFRPILAVLAAVGAFVLLIACANVASLLLARALARRREVAIRVALGATPLRLISQFLVESLVLALIAGAVGSLLGWWSSKLLPVLLPPTNFPVHAGSGIDVRWPLVALALSAITSVLFGLGPALQALRTDVVPALKDEGAASLAGAGRARLRNGLAVLQTILSVVLLISAGLLLKGLRNAQQISPGFNPNGLVLATVDLAGSGYGAERGATLLRELLARTQAAPGVTAASLARKLPMNFGAPLALTVDVEGYERGRDEEVVFGANYVGPDYLRTMETPLLRGREFTLQDDTSAERVAVVNETAERRYWGGDALGRRLQVRGEWLTVVGIAKDSKYDALVEPATPYLFLPLLQHPQPDAVLHVRTQGDPTALVATVRSEVQGIDPTLPVFDVKTMSQHMGIPLFRYRFAAMLLGAFGGLALCLTTVGLYGVVAYGVSQRTSEIGLRMALGAGPREITRMVWAHGLALTGCGVGVGLLASFGAARLLGSLLVDVGSLDPSVHGAVAIGVLVIGLLASDHPARRARRVEPIAALRQ
jgi:predicted permease